MSDLATAVHWDPRPPSIAAAGPVARRRQKRVRLLWMSEPAQPTTEVDYGGLIRGVASRQDRDAFAVLFHHFAPRVKSWMLRAGTSDAAAEELAQETLLTVWRKASLFDPERASVGTWIFTIARNLRIDTLRRETHPSELLDDPADRPDGPEPADHQLAAAERDDRVRTAIALLSPEQADVVRLAFFQDKPHGEIERELGIPLGTVKSRLRLAMAHLRTMLGDFA
jgi:RNA polymerase sigma-70 factor (ECF subfamily)